MYRGLSFFNIVLLLVGGAKDKIASKVVFDGSKGYTDIPGVIKNNFDKLLMVYSYLKFYYLGLKTFKFNNGLKYKNIILYLLFTRL